MGAHSISFVTRFVINGAVTCTQLSGSILQIIEFIPTVNRVFKGGILRDLSYALNDHIKLLEDLTIAAKDVKEQSASELFQQCKSDSLQMS